MDVVLTGGLSLSINFLNPAGVRMLVHSTGGSDYELGIVARSAAHAAEVRGCPGSSVAIRKVAEVKLPFRCLGLGAGASVSMLVALNRGGAEVEHHPRNRPIEFAVPDREFTASHWTA